MLPGTIKVFVGGCHALVLHRRNDMDSHICATLLTEDDGYWFYSKRGGFSSSWLSNVRSLYEEAESWLAKNADPDMHNGRQYGWSERETP